MAVPDLVRCCTDRAKSLPAPAGGALVLGMLWCFYCFNVLHYAAALVSAGCYLWTLLENHHPWLSSCAVMDKKSGINSESSSACDEGECIAEGHSSQMGKVQDMHLTMQPADIQQGLASSQDAANIELKMLQRALQAHDARRRSAESAEATLDHRQKAEADVVSEKDSSHSVQSTLVPGPVPPPPGLAPSAKPGVLQPWQPTTVAMHTQDKLLNFPLRTDTCWSWAKTGQCVRGVRCRWSHPPLVHSSPYWPCNSMTWSGAWATPLVAAQAVQAEEADETAAAEHSEPELPNLAEALPVGPLFHRWGNDKFDAKAWMRMTRRRQQLANMHHL